MGLAPTGGEPMLDLSWKPKYELGVPAMDEQHRRLFFLLTQLRQSVEDRLPPAQVEQVLQSLVLQTAEHLQAEEALLLRAGYPALEDHKVIHEELLSALHGLEVRFKEGDAAMPLLVSAFLGAWLGTHIALEDKAYAAFLAGRA